MMTLYNWNVDLSFLSKEEAREVLGVLERDKRLKQIEMDRLGRLCERRGQGLSLGVAPPLGQGLSLGTGPPPGQGLRLGTVPPLGQGLRLGTVPPLGQGLSLGVAPPPGQGVSLGTVPPPGWQDKLRDEQPVRSSRAHPAYTDQDVVSRGDVRGGQQHPTLRTRLSSMFSLRALLTSRDPAGKHRNHSGRSGDSNAAPAEGQNSAHKPPDPQHPEGARREEELTEGLRTEGARREEEKEEVQEETPSEEQHAGEGSSKELEEEEEPETEGQRTEEDRKLTGPDDTSDNGSDQRLQMKRSRADPPVTGREQDSSTGHPALESDAESHGGHPVLLREPRGLCHRSQVTGQDFGRNIQREDPENSTTKQAPGPQSTGYHGEKHSSKDPKANLWSGECIPLSAEMKTSLAPNRTKPSVCSVPTDDHHSANSPSKAEHTGRVHLHKTTPSFLREQGPPDFQSYDTKWKEFWKTSSCSDAEPSPRHSQLQPCSVESPGAFSVFRPSTSVVMHTSGQGKASCRPSIDHAKRPAVWRAHFSRSQPTLFPASDSDLAKPAGRTHPHSIPSQSPLGYSRRLNSSVIFRSMYGNSHSAAAAESPRVSHSLITVKSQDSALTEAVTMVTADDSRYSYTAPRNTRWMSSSERINILAKQHSLAAQAGALKVSSPPENLHLKSSFQTNHRGMLRHKCRPNDASTIQTTTSPTSHGPGGSRHSQSPTQSLTVPPAPKFEMNIPHDGTYRTPPGTNIFLKDKVKTRDSDVTDKTPNNDECTAQTTNGGVSTQASSGWTALDASPVFERHEKEPSVYQGNSKVEQILNRLRVTFGGRRVEEKSVLFGRKGVKTVTSAGVGASDIIGCRKAVESRMPQVKEALRPTHLENNISARKGRKVAFSKENHENSVQSSEQQGPTTYQQSSYFHKPWDDELQMSARSVANNLYIGVDREHTQNQDVFYSISNHNSKCDRRNNMTFFEHEAKGNQHKTAQLPYLSHSNRHSSSSGLKHGRSISVSNIYSNRRSGSRQMSTGSDVAVTRDLRSMEDLSWPGDSGCPIRGQLRAFSCSLTQSSDVDLMMLQTTAEVSELTAYQTALASLSHRERPTPTGGCNSSLSDCEERDSDTSTDGEYYFSDDWEKESIL